MANLDNQILKNYFRDGKYDDCIRILKNKITTFVINQIKNEDSSITFTTVSDLISASEFYLGNSTISKNLKYALSLDNKIEQIEALTSICEKFDIK